MNKPTVSPWKEPVRWICNEAYFGVRNLDFIDKRYYKTINSKYIPAIIKNNFDNILAFKLGGASGAMGAGILDLTFRYGIQDLIEKYSDFEPTIEGAAVVGFAVVGGFFARSITDTGARQFMKEHNLYASGLKGVATGASLVAGLELLL